MPPSWRSSSLVLLPKPVVAAPRPSHSPSPGSHHGHGSEQGISSSSERHRAGVAATSGIPLPAPVGPPAKRKVICVLQGQLFGHCMIPGALAGPATPQFITGGQRGQWQHGWDDVVWHWILLRVLVLY